jgi:hypothetical protein
VTRSILVSNKITTHADTGDVSINIYSSLAATLSSTEFVTMRTRRKENAKRRKRQSDRERQSYMKENEPT